MSGLAPPEPVASALDRVWEAMARPGTWWSGVDRVALARVARATRSRREAVTSLPEAAVDAARWLSVDAGGIRAPFVDGLVQRGLSRVAYVEIIGVVSRLAAVDGYVLGIGGPEVPLPDPLGGEPSRLDESTASLGAGWVPMVGPGSAPTALSSVPSEHAAQEDLHAALYLAYGEMVDIQYRAAIDRAQMELVAARVSFLNECFY